MGVCLCVCCLYVWRAVVSDDEGVIHSIIQSFIRHSSFAMHSVMQSVSQSVSQSVMHLFGRAVRHHAQQLDGLGATLPLGLLEERE